MVKKYGLEPPYSIEAENVVLERHQLLPFCQQVDQFLGDVLEVLVAPVEADHSLNDPLVLDFIVEVATEYSFVERGGVGVEDGPVPFFQECFDMLEDNQGHYLSHDVLEYL